MKFENVKEGMIIKNYKELCTLLEIPVVKANSKVAQLKQIDSMIEYKKEGHKYIIEKVREKPVYTSNTQGIYASNNEIILCYLLEGISTETECLTLSVSALARIFGFYNENFFSYKNLTDEELCVQTGLNKRDSKAVVEDFYNRVSSSYRSSVKSTLRRLRDKNVIVYNTSYQAFAYDENTMEEILEQVETNPNICMNTIIKKYKYAPRRHYHLKFDDYQEYLKIAFGILEEMGARDTREIIRTGRMYEYSNKLSVQLCKRLKVLRINHAYIIYYVREIIDNYIDIVTSESCYRNTNSEFYKKILENKEKRDSTLTGAKEILQKSEHFKELCNTNLKLSEQEHLNFDKMSELLIQNKRMSLETAQQILNEQENSLEVIEKLEGSDMIDSFLNMY